MSAASPAVIRRLYKQILLNAQNPDKSVREPAEQQLTEGLDKHPNEFFKMLVQELSNDGAPEQ